MWNYRGESVDISQDNTNIRIPFFLSSNGYGIFWNNTSRSRFNNRFLHALYFSSEVADIGRLLLPLRSGIRQDYRRLPRSDRLRAAVRQVGLRLLAMQEQIQVAG